MESRSFSGWAERCFTLLLVAALAISGTGCVSAKSRPHERIETVDGGVVECTRTFPEWDLEVETYSVHECFAGGSGQALALGCLVVMGVVVPVGSAMVSGSVYVVGNTLHWAEKNTGCSAVPDIPIVPDPLPAESPLSEAKAVVDESEL